MENNSIKRLCGMICLAMRAGKLTLGADMVCLKMQKRHAQGSPELIILAQGASSATRERLIKKSEYYEVKLIEIPVDMGELGRMLGKTYAPAVVSVNDKGFARTIAELNNMCTVNDTDQGAASEQILRKDVSGSLGNGD